MTEILLPCPFCGGKAKLNDCLEIDPIMDENGAYIDADINVFPSWVECTVCGAMGESFDNDEEADTEKAIAAWNRRPEPINTPLTLEELRGMIGNPVWVTHKDGSGGRWGIVNQYDIGLCADTNAGTAYWFDDYCGTIAYRRKPESEADA